MASRYNRPFNDRRPEARYNQVINEFIIYERESVMPRQFIIDTDVGSDDAVALLMAFRHPDVEVIAVTTVAGNVPVDQATINALVVAELCGVEVPVYPGADRPLTRPYRDAKFFHGQDGLGDQGYPTPTQQAQTKHAVPAMIEAIRANPGCVLVTLGPLTNVALAIRQDPGIIGLVDRCVVMGGAAATYGNITPAAEFNIWCDPEAARIVFRSGMAVEMVGWEFCIGDYAINTHEIAQLRALDTPYAHFTIDCNVTAIEAYHKQTGGHGISLPDPVTMAVAIDRSIATQALHYVDVECDSELTRGMTVVDKLGVSGDAYNQPAWGEVRLSASPVHVTWDVDVVRWKQMLFELVK